MTNTILLDQHSDFLAQPTQSLVHDSPLRLRHATSILLNEATRYALLYDINTNVTVEVFHLSDSAIARLKRAAIRKFGQAGQSSVRWELVDFAEYDNPYTHYFADDEISDWWLHTTVLYWQ